MTRTEKDLAAHLTDVISFNAVDILAYFERRVGTNDAADLVAETMLTAWRKAADVPEDTTEARMWLFGVARNVLANADRAERRRWRLADRLRLMLHPESTAPASDAGLDVRDAVARLDPDIAELIRLVHWDRLTIAQAAQVTGIPASTARSRYQKAKDDLRAQLSVTNPELHPPSDGRSPRTPRRIGSQP